MKLIKPIIYVLSPTYLYADYKKKTFNDKLKADFISRKNKKYLYYSSVLFIVFLFIDIIPKLKSLITYNNYHYYIYFVIFYFCFSRVNEIFISFLDDAMEKLNLDYKISFFSFKDRIKLALKSYFELIINYALMYYILYECFGYFNVNYLRLYNFLYYSCTTITTLGYGDIHSTHWVPQFLSVYEIFNGMILVIVCFAIYVSLNYNKELLTKIKNYRSHYDPDESKIKSEYKMFKHINKFNLIIAGFILFIILALGFIIIYNSESNLVYSLITYLTSLLIVNLLILS